MEILNNELDESSYNPLDDIDAFIMVGNAQNFLDELHKETTKPMSQKFGAVIIDSLKDYRTYAPVLRYFSYKF